MAKSLGLIILFVAWIFENNYTSEWKGLRQLHDLYGDGSNSLTTKIDIDEIGYRTYEVLNELHPSNISVQISYKNYLYQFCYDNYLNSKIDAASLNLDKNTFSDEAYDKENYFYDSCINVIEIYKSNKDLQISIDSLKKIANTTKGWRGDVIQGNILNKITEHRNYVKAKEEFWNNTFFWAYVIGSILLAIAYSLNLYYFENPWKSGSGK